MQLQLRYSTGTHSTSSTSRIVGNSLRSPGEPGGGVKIILPVSASSYTAHALARNLLEIDADPQALANLNKLLKAIQDSRLFTQLKF